MRIWKYYLDRAALKVNEGVAFTTSRERYALYAITNDKKKAREFKASRNEKAFIEQTAKVDKDEWKAICQKYRGCVLLYTDLLTKQDRDKIENPITLDDYTKLMEMVAKIFACCQSLKKVRSKICRAQTCLQNSLMELCVR